MLEEVQFSTMNNGAAIITLNRPQALNSLTHNMLEAINSQLDRWEEDDHVHFLLIKGSGKKGLCAGGDIKSLYQAKLGGERLRDAEEFFSIEYQVDQKIYNYSKPIIVCLDGIVMGGAVGLTYGADYRIVTERTRWSMPEMNIGFFPDVGSAFFLNQAPGHIGRYLALTGAVIQAPDVLYINGADVWMRSEEMDQFIVHLEKQKWDTTDIHKGLQSAIASYTAQPIGALKLSALQEEIDKHFSYDTVEEIMASLSLSPTVFAKETFEKLDSISPLSLKVTLKQQIDGKEMSREGCFEMDKMLSKHFMRHPDFFEGVRALLIDKDKNPDYVYKQLSDVDAQTVNRFFKKDLQHSNRE